MLTVQSDQAAKVCLKYLLIRSVHVFQYVCFVDDGNFHFTHIFFQLPQHLAQSCDNTLLGVMILTASQVVVELPDHNCVRVEHREEEVHVAQCLPWHTQMSLLSDTSDLLI